MIVPKKLAVKFNPPTLLLEFSNQKSLKHYIVPLDEYLSLGTTARTMASEIISKHSVFQEVPRRKLAEPLNDVLDRYTATVDLNKESTETIKAVKKQMNETFEKNRIKPTDEGFVYDRKVTFHQDITVTNDWDEESDDSFEEIDSKDDINISFSTDIKEEESVNDPSISGLMDNLDFTDSSESEDSLDDLLQDIEMDLNM
ncbi:hypothetical protein PCE1_004056 [Barthelona sp. PCE]